MSPRIRLMVASVVVLGVGAGLASLGHLPPPPIAGEPPGPRPEPPRPAGEPPRFAVALRADKPSYIQREPIRLCATLRNAGADEFRVAHYPDQPVATVEYFRVDETGEAAALDKASLSEGVRCGNVDLNVPVIWSIAKGATINRSTWDENLYEPGSAAFRAAITIEGGAHKGKRFGTGDLRVAIAPAGGRPIPHPPPSPRSHGPSDRIKDPTRPIPPSASFRIFADRRHRPRIARPACNRLRSAPPSARQSSPHGMSPGTRRAGRMPAAANENAASPAGAGDAARDSRRAGLNQPSPRPVIAGCRHRSGA